jgi:hypothetical protein
VDEEFQGGFRPGGGADGGDLFKVELARKHDLRQAYILQKAGFFRRADVGLGAGVQLDRRQVELQQAHVLQDQRVDAGVVQLPDLLARRFEFVVGEDGVEGDEHARVVAVRVFGQPRDVGDFVGCRRARAERRPADIHRIGAVVDGFDADIGVTRGGEQFELMGVHRRASEQLKLHFTGDRPARPAYCAGLLTASIARVSVTSSLTKGTFLPMLNSERLIWVVALAPQASTFSIGCGWHLKWVISSVTCLVTSLMVRSPTMLDRLVAA